MFNSTNENRTRSCFQGARGILPMAGASGLALALAATLAQPARADEVAVPPVPAGVQVPTGNEAFLVGHATGTQNYVCLPAGTSVAFTLFTPQATLFNGEAEQIITHFFGPNPFEDNANPAVVTDHAIRAAWQSRDTSTVWGQVKPGNSSTDARFVAQGAIPWLLVTIVGAEDGPTGGDALSKTTFIQRLNTAGGVAPPSGCTSATDVGHEAFVPYTADYFFYRPKSR